MCLTTTCESQCITVDLAPDALAKSRLERTASYSTSLLVVKNWRWTAHSIVSPSSDYIKTPAPLAHWLDELSVHIVHAISFSSLSSPVMNSTMKSTKACALIMVLGRYWTSNSLSLIAHKTSRRATSELFIVFHNGLSIWTTMVCT